MSRPVTIIQQGNRSHTVTLVATGGGTGAPGASAYQLAVREGFTGTANEWLASLRGPAGRDGAGAPGSMYLTWLMGLQYDTPGLPADGAIKWHDSVATRGPDGTEYYRIEPYFAHLAAVFAMQADAAAVRSMVARWLNWWAGRRTGAVGSTLVAWATADGSQVLTAIPGANPPVTPDDEDATDSNLALWLLALSRYVALFGTQDLRPDWLVHARGVFDTLYGPLVRDPADDLTWAKPTWPIKYLMDNVEVWAAVNAAAALFARQGDNTRRDLARDWADRLRVQISRPPAQGGLWQDARGWWAVHKDGAGTVQPASTSVAYPDALAQVWPCIFGMDSTLGGYGPVSLAWPNWAFGQVAEEGGHADSAIALAAVRQGYPGMAQRWLLASAARQTPEGSFPYPFLCATAAMAAVAAAANSGSAATRDTAAPDLLAYYILAKS